MKWASMFARFKHHWIYLARRQKASVQGIFIKVCNLGSNNKSFEIHQKGEIKDLTSMDNRLFEIIIKIENYVSKYY